MKITTFNPKIITQDTESAVKLFESLGFETSHEIELLDGQNITNYRMKDANGNHVDITGVDNLPRDMMTIRMNVDDFDEAYNLLTDRGFKQVRDIVETESNKTVMMIAPSGFMFDLCQHKRR